MHALWQLLIRYSTFATFIFLEGIAMYLVVSYNTQQGAIFDNSVGIVTGVFKTNTSRVRDYLNLNAVADSLANENAQLRNQLAKNRYVTIHNLDTAYVKSLDSLSAERHEPFFDYIAGSVIGNSVHLRHNYILLNIGRHSGVRVGDGVIGHSGPVGIVVGVSNRFSRVMSILNAQIKISAVLNTKRGAYLGAIHWDGDEGAQYLTLDDIPQYTQVSKGDTIYTSGYSTLFPKGLMIGQVDTAWVNPGSNYYTILAKNKQSLTALNRVYVISNLFRNELDSLNTTDLYE